jgi:alkylated DNA repair dioxygenase AlkB
MSGSIQMSKLNGFEGHALGGGDTFWVGTLPSALMFDKSQFETLWNLHPEHKIKIRMHGRQVETPRYQQAYGVSYHYSGQKNEALPIPPVLASLLDWAAQSVDGRLNALLLNWYDGALGHYIGHHRDSTKNMIEGCPIVTISFGEERIFRLRPWRGTDKSKHIDFRATNGSVFVMSYETNQRWTHEVPPSRRWRGNRISVTIRGLFELKD